MDRGCQADGHATVMREILLKTPCPVLVVGVGVIPAVAGGRASGLHNVTFAKFENDVMLSAAVEASGNRYIADTSNHRIPKVTPQPSRCVPACPTGRGTEGATGLP